MGVEVATGLAEARKACCQAVNCSELRLTSCPSAGLTPQVSSGLCSGKR